MDDAPPFFFFLLFQMRREGSAYLPAMEWHTIHTKLTQAHVRLAKAAKTAAGTGKATPQVASLDVLAAVNKDVVRKHRRALLKQTLAELEEQRKGLFPSSGSFDTQDNDLDDDDDDDDDDLDDD